MFKTKRFLLAAVCTAITFTFFACSSDNPTGETQQSSSSIYAPPTQSSSGKTKLYCDYGPVTEFGGGCFEIDDIDECEWGQVVNACNNNPPPTQSSSSRGTNNTNSNSSTATKPSVPANVKANQYFGSYIEVSWNSVSNAESYEIYRSTTATGSYSRIGTQSGTYSTSYEDNSPRYGDNYYKVIAVNNAGKSDYSDYAYYDFSFEPCLTNITATAGTISGAGMAPITIKWSISTAKGCSKPTSITCHGEADGLWTNINVSATATSCSVSSARVNSSNCFKYGVEATNAKGTFSRSDIFCK